jgi:hypothetical protein
VEEARHDEQTTEFNDDNDNDKGTYLEAKLICAVGGSMPTSLGRLKKGE